MQLKIISGWFFLFNNKLFHENTNAVMGPFTHHLPGKDQVCGARPGQCFYFVTGTKQDGGSGTNTWKVSVNGILQACF